MIDTCRYLVRFADGEETWERWVPESRFRHRAGHGEQYEAEWKDNWLPVEFLQKKKAICRKERNRRIELIKRMFKWAASEELVPASVYQALTTVRGWLAPILCTRHCESRINRYRCVLGAA